jgi:hypothetical protein
MTEHYLASDGNTYTTNVKHDPYDTDYGYDWTGCIEEVNDRPFAPCVTYMARDYNEAVQEFKNSVEDYIQFMKEEFGDDQNT